MRKFAFILFLSIAFQGVACTCFPPEKLEVARKREIANSNFIIIGNVIRISEDKQTLTVIIKEVFKGKKLNNDTIVTQNNYYCEPVVNTTGEWLFYGNLIENEFIYNECGLSRSLQFPEQNSFFTYTPPPQPPGREVKNGVSLEIKIKNEKLNATRNAHKKLIEEIRILRSLRMKLNNT